MLLFSMKFMKVYADPDFILVVRVVSLSTGCSQLFYRTFYLFMI